MTSFHESANARDLDLYIARLFLPLGRGVVALGDASAANLTWLRARYGEARFVVVPPQKIVDRIIARFASSLSDEAIHALDRRAPLLSARRVVTRSQARALALFAATLAALAWLEPGTIVTALVGLMSVLFAFSVGFRALLALWGAAPEARPDAAPGDDLPVYTILVPLYRETAVLHSLARALLALDYPRALLDIKLVVEADDAETAQACRALEGPFEVIAVPASLPRTKPKAVNFALRFARGDHVVIYDAEDRPEPDQLRKAVAAFRDLPQTVACLQARLAFYNAYEGGWLTKLFALDYGLWFGMLLPGLERLGVPIPLGGTSNHFRAPLLREIGAWDPFNVTEDADLGIRISQRGWRVAMLDSTTFEEAPSRVDVWIKQRSRWLKGYMQTWLVHGRGTRALIRHTGWRGFLSFQLFIGGAVLSALINPLLWAIAIGFALFGSHIASEVSAAGVVGSNGMLTFLALASARRGERQLAPYALTVTLYWVLISIAGYRALWHLLIKPFHWEKTAHGLGTHA